jgi:hypothetical protein
MSESGVVWSQRFVGRPSVPAVPLNAYAVDVVTTTGTFPNLKVDRVASSSPDN